MEPLASPLRIPIIHSTSITRLVYGGHVLASLILIIVFPLSNYSVLAVFGVCVSFIVQHLSRTDLASRVEAILLRSNGQWSIITRQGEIEAARTVGRTFVSPWLVILFLKPAGQTANHILLSRDNTNRDTFRRLRVRLRIPM